MVSDKRCVFFFFFLMPVVFRYLWCYLVYCVKNMLNLLGLVSEWISNLSDRSLLFIF